MALSFRLEFEGGLRRNSATRVRREILLRYVKASGGECAFAGKKKEMWHVVCSCEIVLTQKGSF